METNSVYEKWSRRTGNAVYIGVTGPTRTGKSTFVKRVMETLVIPHIDDPYLAERAKDEVPQCGSGRTIMTAEPKFVPEEAVEISPDGVSRLSVRLIDSVGYVVPGAVGAEEDGQPRMVTTPWFDEEIPLAEAAEIGTRKVMEDHCTVGVVVTTDGTVTELPREDYRAAEGKAIADMQATGKPFVVLVNSTQPRGETALAVQKELEEAYGVCVLTADCQTMEAEQLAEVLTQVLRQFPATEVRYYLPGWMSVLDCEHPVKSALYEAMLRSGERIRRISEAEPAIRELVALDSTEGVEITDVDLGQGIVTCRLTFPESLFYEILSEKSGVPVENDGELMSLLSSLAEAKRSYEKVESALAQVRATGYGIVEPTPEEIRLAAPEIIRKGGNYAIKLRASAPSIHMIRTDVQAETSPIVGDEAQSKELAEHLLAEYADDTEKLWSSNLFGKSLYELVSEGLSSKITALPEDFRCKFRGTLTKVVNEGGRSLFCIVL